jgi:plasmid stabilization system protein ParE
VKVKVLDPAEGDLQETFDYYEKARTGLGTEFAAEFRRTVDRILNHPHAWHPLDPVYRRCQLHRFPYGVIYRVEDQAKQIVVVAVTHLSRKQDWWRGRIP